MKILVYIFGIVLAICAVSPTLAYERWGERRGERFGERRWGERKTIIIKT